MHGSCTTRMAVEHSRNAGPPSHPFKQYTQYALILAGRRRANINQQVGAKSPEKQGSGRIKNLNKCQRVKSANERASLGAIIPIRTYDIVLVLWDTRGDFYETHELF